MFQMLTPIILGALQRHRNVNNSQMFSAEPKSRRGAFVCCCACQQRTAANFCVALTRRPGTKQQKLINDVGEP